MVNNTFSNRYVNFYSELNMRFNEEIKNTKQHCIGLTELSDVFEIERQENQIVLNHNSNAAVGAIHEVEKLAKSLGKKYDLNLIFK